MSKRDDLFDDVPDELADELAAVGWSEPPEEPTAAMRERLFAAIGPSPLDAMVAPLAAFFDVAAGAARALCDSLGRESVWEAGPIPGLFVAHVPAGAARAGAYAGLVRMTPGLQFPAHRHVGDERMLVLAGGLRQHDGRECHAGDILDSRAGSRHDFVVIGDEPCIAAVIQYDGIDFGPG